MTKIESEQYWVLKTGENTYARVLDGYHNGAIDTAWGSARTAEHFDTREAAIGFADSEGIVATAVRVVERLYIG